MPMFKVLDWQDCRLHLWNQMLPMLTDRVHAYLMQKQADFDLLNEKLAVEIEMEGC